MARADAGDLVDVAYRTIDSPVGPLLLAATPQGLLRVAYESEDHDQVLATLAEQVSPRIMNAPRRLDPAARDSTSTSRARGSGSTCRWTSACRGASG